MLSSAPALGVASSATPPREAALASSSAATPGPFARDSSSAPAIDSPPDPTTIVLDPIEATAPRTDPVTLQIRQNQIDDAREADSARRNREGAVSRALNGWRLPFFSIGLTADRLANGADRRSEILAQERIVLLALRDAKTSEERGALDADLRALRELRRSIVAADPRPDPFTR